MRKNSSAATRKRKKGKIFSAGEFGVEPSQTILTPPSRMVCSFPK
jgi:hypothetical protein